jgi:hypothetical protein
VKEGIKRLKKPYFFPRLRPTPHPKIYFCFRSSNLDEIFREGVFRAGHLTAKISARNIEPIKSYLKIKGQNIGVRASQISLPFQTLESSGLFYHVTKVWGYNLTEPDFLIIL